MEATKIRWSDSTWNPILTHPGYSASADGQIKGPSGKVLRPMVNESGHLYVLTPPPRSPRKLFVHRAVLAAFVGPCPDGCEALHRNGDPADNRVENLTWGTRSENAADRRSHGGYERDRWTTRKLTDDDVVEILTSTESSRTIAARLGVSHTTVLNLRRRQQ